MIQSFMFCGIGLLAGCLLMLMFIPLVHERAVRITKRQIVDATPLTVNEIQADKDHLRAEFAMSVRRLEISMEEMRAKATSRYSDAHKQNAEISRLQVELDRKMAAIFALRTREQVRKGAVKRVLKLLLYFYMRSRRQLQPPVDEAAHAEIRRLQVALDKRMSRIFALRAREQLRKGAVKRVLKLLLYFYMRTRRQRQPPLFEPVDDAAHAEISRLQVELDKRTTMIFALRTREQVRKGVLRRALKILLYFYMRTHRQRRPLAPPRLEPVKDQSLRVNQRSYGQPAERSELAAAAAAVAAINLKRRRAATNRL